MGKVTKVFNKTEEEIELKQGSANVFHTLHPLPPGQSCKINVDESATYREYWCAMQPNNNDTTTGRVVFSSDDCIEYSEVKIYKDGHKYKWKGTERRGPWRNTPILTQDAETPTRWQQFTGFFRKKN